MLIETQKFDDSDLISALMFCDQFKSTNDFNEYSEKIAVKLIKTVLQKMLLVEL